MLDRNLVLPHNIHMNTNTYPELLARASRMLDRADASNDIASKPAADGKYIRTPWGLCEKIVSEIARTVSKTISRDHEDAYLYQDALKGKKILVVDTMEFIPVLLHFGAEPCNITFVAPYVFKGKIAAILLESPKNVVPESLLTWKTNMKFDVVVGNPPFNRSAGGVAGTGGDNFMYRKFYDVAVNLKPKPDVIALILPKGILEHIKGENFSSVDLMTEDLWDDKEWVYDTCVIYHIINNSQNQIKSAEPIVNKIFTTSQNFNYNFYNGAKNPKPVRGSGKFVRGIIEHKTSDSQEIYGDIDTTIATARGPKFISNGFGRSSSWLVTEEHTCVGGFTVYFNTLDEANKFRLFLQNNKVLEFFRRKMKEKKGVARLVRYIKSFDVSKIVTGFEYPDEWQLNDEEKQFIEQYDF